MYDYQQNPLAEKINDGIDLLSDWLFSNDRFFWIGISIPFGIVAGAYMAKNLWIPLFFG